MFMMLVRYQQQISRRNREELSRSIAEQSPEVFWLFGGRWYLPWLHVKLKTEIYYWLGLK
jgi:hypothetical protein